VLVLPMASLLAIEIPPVPADQPQNFRHLHADQCDIGRN
jgi:hypothetical protein